MPKVNFTFEVSRAPSTEAAWAAVDKADDALILAGVRTLNGVYVTELDDGQPGCAGEFDVEVADAAKLAQLEAAWIALVRLNLPSEPTLRVRCKGRESVLGKA